MDEGRAPDLGTATALAVEVATLVGDGIENPSTNGYLDRPSTLAAAGEAAAPRERSTACSYPTSTGPSTGSTSKTWPSSLATAPLLTLTKSELVKVS